MNNIFKKYAVVALSIVLFSSCEKSEYQTIEEMDDQNIREYIQKNNLSVEEFEQTGIFYSIIKEGTGRDLDYTERIPLVYTLSTLDGSYHAADTFSSSNRYYDYLGYFPYGSISANASGSPLDKEEGLKLLLNQALKKANGKIRVIIPSRMAFGRKGTRDIPPNASIDYQIHAIDPESIDSYEDESIKAYLTSIGLQPTEFEKTTTGIYYKIEQPGTGEFIGEEDSFSAAYELKFLNGNTFQKSDSAHFKLKNTIAAWQEIIPKLKPKGKARILIPSSQAYGLQGSFDQNTLSYLIPPFSSLDYQVTIIEK